jgi:hypothetical protein
MKDCQKFFENFGISVKVYDIFNNNIYNFDSSRSKNKKIPNNPLYLIYHNNHVQKIENSNSFIKSIKENDLNEIKELKKTNYNYKPSNYNDFIIIKCADEIINHIKTLDVEK